MNQSINNINNMYITILLCLIISSSNATLFDDIKNAYN